jgi:hypothetical protein
MTIAFAITAVIVACILLDVRHTRRLDQHARRNRRQP